MAEQVNRIIFKVESDTTGIMKALDKVDGKLEDVAEGEKKVSKGADDMSGAFGGAGSALDRMTGGAVSGLRGMVGGLRTAVTGLKSVKVAIAATGVGLLVIAFGSLVAFFTKSKRGADLLERATAGLGIIMDKLLDGAIWLGETLVNTFSAPGDAIKGIGTAIKEFVMDKINKLMEGLGFLGSAFKKLFSGDFKGAMADGAKGVLSLNRALNPMVIVTELVIDATKKVVEVIGEFAGSVGDALVEIDNLTLRSQALRQAQRDLNVEFAEGRAQIKELNLIAEDMSKPLLVRIKAAEDAIAIEQELMTERQRIAQEELDIFNAKMAMSENTEDDLQKQNDLEVALITIRTESAEMQTTLNNKLQTMRKAAADESKRLHEEEQTRIQERIESTMEHQDAIDEVLATDRQNEIEAVREKWRVIEADATTNKEILIGLEEAKGREIDAVNEKWNAKKRADDKAVLNSKVDMTKAALGALMALNKAFEGDSEADREKSFKRNKALALSMAIVNTGQAVVNALTAGGNPLKLATGAQFVEAGIAATIGAAQIASIARTKFQPGGSSPPPSGTLKGGGGGGTGATDAPPSIDFGFLGSGSGQQGIQAYVISQNVTDQQQANQLIQDQVVL